MIIPRPGFQCFRLSWVREGGTVHRCQYFIACAIVVSLLSTWCLRASVSFDSRRIRLVALDRGLEAGLRSFQEPGLDRVQGFKPVSRNSLPGHGTGQGRLKID